jgi:hypothetical protein
MTAFTFSCDIALGGVSRYGWFGSRRCRRAPESA